MFLGEGAHAYVCRFTACSSFSGALSVEPSVTSQEFPLHASQGSWNPPRKLSGPSKVTALHTLEHVTMYGPSW